MTNSRLVQNGFIFIYQYILNILNHEPTNYITNDRIKAFIEVKVCFKSLNFPSSLCSVKFCSVDSKKYPGFFSTKYSSSFLYCFNLIMSDSHYVYRCFLKRLFCHPRSLPRYHLFFHPQKFSSS